ncbi:MAG: hypothetical protein K0S47_2927 [Herbinix sp.]|jgi:hypothetical protein|nr:hypothetical protein [Herbinix sp.]
MKTLERKIVWVVILSMGFIGVIFYLSHVFIGGAMWRGYNHVRQAVSDLTADGAPNADLLRNLAGIYAIANTIFSIGLLFYLKDRVNKVTKAGLFSFVIMELCSGVGYRLFPLAEEGTTMNFQNTMHIVITIIVVITTMAAMYLTALGMLRLEEYKKLGLLSLVSAIIITVSGISTGMVTAAGIPILGLVERINIFTLLTWVTVFSINSMTTVFRYEKR